MSPELATKLISAYPEQFKNLTWIECGDGWFNILSRLCYIVDCHLVRKKKLNEPLDLFCWQQIKEKFGGLRAYAYSADDFIKGAIEMAESMSYITCEVTGEKGKLRKQRKNDEGDEPIPAWIKTLCDSEAEKEGYIV
jgi:hypothetical protein